MDNGDEQLDFNPPVRYQNTFLYAAGAFLPGEPIANDRLDAFISPLNSHSDRIKRRVLKDNGIESRHYAIDESGKTRFSCTEMAALAVQDCLAKADLSLRSVSLLCAGTSGSDSAMPGFANMLQGELAAPPMETSSHHGVCAAGIAALKHAAASVELGEHRYALVAASEFSSRMFKRTRFSPIGYNADFDSHFLRWMLSDGSGALLLGSTPDDTKPRIRVRWIHLRSFSGDFPVCMQIGFPSSGSTCSYLDYDSLLDAERDGAFLLRQDIRLLPNLFDVGIHEYARLVSAGYLDPKSITHFLCHYSSEKLRGVVESLMDNAGLRIPAERWYSNLKKRGNTGSASIFIMLADFLKETSLKAGDQIFCFIPESGRFTVSYVLLEVESAPGAIANDAAVLAPTSNVGDLVGSLLRGLAEVWHQFRSRMWRSELIQRISKGELTVDEYKRWMEVWIPQVREGTVWMRRAVDNLDERYAALRTLISEHATEEQFDYRMLFDDYRQCGGNASHIDALHRNAGGEALNAYMHSRAATPNPVGLLGAIYIIEGTGQRIIPTLVPLLRRQTALADTQLKFLRYHGENDERHMARWMNAVSLAAQIGGADVCADILNTSKAVAELYALQMEYVL